MINTTMKPEQNTEDEGKFIEKPMPPNIDPPPRRNHRGHTRSDSGLLHPGRLRGPRHERGQEHTSHLGTAIPEYGRRSHQCERGTNTIQHQREGGEILVQAKSGAMLHDLNNDEA